MISELVPHGCKFTRQSLGVRATLKGGEEDKAIITFTKTPKYESSFYSTSGTISILKCIIRGAWVAQSLSVCLLLRA